ncbi:MAG: hypothetical protein ACMXX8_02210 [Candidatus Woesearchaeota archaeon]
MKLKIIIILTLSLLIFPLVNATFSAQMYSQSSEICTCSSLEDVIIITNNQPFSIAYTVSTSGNFQKFYSLSESFFILEPFETIEIIGFFNPDCGFYGKDNIEIIIETNQGNKRSLKKEISVLNCNNNLLNYRIGNSFINEPCKETVFPLTISNIGQYIEIYDLSVENINSKYVYFSDNNIILQPGESKDIEAYILMPCENYGEYTGNFVSTARNSKLVSKVPFKLTINRNYNYSISLGFYENNIPFYKEDLNYEFCADLMYNIPVEINNEVFISNAYNIQLKNNEWISSDVQRIGLHGNQSKIFNLSAKPTKENIGNHNYNLEITSVRGDLKTSADLEFNIIDCSSFDIELNYNPVSCCGKNIYQLVIENKADINNEFLIESDSNIFLYNNSYYNNIILNIDPKSIVEIDVYFDLSCDEENEFKIKASNFLESKEIIIPFETYSIEDCQKIILDSRKSEIVFYEWKKIPLIFKNIGIRGSNYNVSIEAPEWITIDDEIFYLNPEEKKVIYLYSNPDPYVEKGKYYINIIHYSDNQYGHFNQIEIELKVWNFADATYLFVRNNKGIVILLALILIVLILILFYFIKDFKRKQKTKPKKEIKETKQSKKSSKKRNYKKLFGWILLLLLLIGLTIYFLYFFEREEHIEYTEEKEIDEDLIYNETINETEVIVNETINESLIIKPIEKPKIPPEEEKYEYLVENNLLDSFLYQVWYQNEILKLDLDNNFEDPDGEPLTYSSSIPQNIEIFIDGSIVHLTPKQDWTGIEKIYFRATDTAGDYVISPEVTLIVREKIEIEEKSYFSNLFKNLGIYTQLYLFYVIIGVILLLIILLVLSRNNDNKNKKKN